MALQFTAIFRVVGRIGQSNVETKEGVVPLSSFLFVAYAHGSLSRVLGAELGPSDLEILKTRIHFM